MAFAATWKIFKNFIRSNVDCAKLKINRVLFLVLHLRRVVEWVLLRCRRNNFWNLNKNNSSIYTRNAALTTSLSLKLLIAWNYLSTGFIRNVYIHIALILITELYFNKLQNLFWLISGSENNKINRKWEWIEFATYFWVFIGGWNTVANWIRWLHWERHLWWLH